MSLEQRRVLWRYSRYEPTPLQLAAHLDTSRLKLVAGGERGGKSRWTGEEMLTWMGWRGVAGRFWIVGPTYELARPDFLHLSNAASYAGLLVPSSLSIPQQGQCSFETVLGASIITRTSRDVETLAGEAPDGIAMVEAAQQTYESFLRLRGRVAENRAPLILSGTFEGSLGWYPELWASWQADNLDGGRSFSLPTWSNEAVFPGGREDPEIRAIEATFPRDVFQERFGAVPCPPATLVFKEFSHLLHVQSCPYRSGEPVQLWVDPGYAHKYAVNVVQVRDGLVYHIDEVWRSGTVAQELIAEVKARPWYGDVSIVVMCMGGRQHQGMESHAEIWRNLVGAPVYSQAVPIADGILRHRTFLIGPETREPRMFYDPQCKGSIWEYGQYKYNEVRENRPIRELPIDRDDDALKATAYGLVHNFGFVEQPRARPQVSVRVRRN